MYVWKCRGSPPSKQSMVRAATFIFLRFTESVKSAGLARCSANGCWPIIRCSPQSAFLCSARTQFAQSFELRVILLVLSDGHRNVSSVAVMSAASDAAPVLTGISHAACNAFHVAVAACHCVVCFRAKRPRASYCRYEYSRKRFIALAVEKSEG